MNPEQAKYEALWGAHPEYRNFAPGERLADHFLSVARPLPHQLCYDFGCGTGRGAARISKRCKVVGLDFAENCLDPEVRGQFEFRQHDLTQPVEGPVADFGYCTDVLEHIAPEDVPAVLSNIVKAARRVYLCISTVEDKMGALIGEPLHLTVQPMSWWKEQLEALKFTVAVEQDLGNACVFYGSAWATFNDFEHRATLNTEDQQIHDNIKANLALGLQEVAPHDAQDTEIMLLCGGPSLNEFKDEIIAANRAGMPAVTVNGTYNWLIENGGRPGAQVIVDARSFNKRFTEPTVLQCKYLISSQCDPEMVRSLPKAQTYLWHGAGDAVKAAIEEYSTGADQGREWFPVPGGTTVTLRTFPLLGLLGYRKIHVYGFDSCLRGTDHHAYSQPENDQDQIMEVVVGGKTFYCHSWMAKQAHEFQEVVRYLLAPAGIELAIYGDGLIATILKVASATTQE